MSLSFGFTSVPAAGAGTGTTATDAKSAFVASVASNGVTGARASSTDVKASAAAVSVSAVAKRIIANMISTLKEDIKENGNICVVVVANGDIESIDGNAEFEEFITKLSTGPSEIASCFLTLCSKDIPKEFFEGIDSNQQRQRFAIKITPDGNYEVFHVNSFSDVEDKVYPEVGKAIAAAGAGAAAPVPTVAPAAAPPAATPKPR